MHDKWPSSSIADSNFVLGNAQVPPAYPIVYCSDGFCELTGYTRAQIMQKGCACKFLFGSETEKGQIGEITKALQDKTELKLELQLYKKNGKSFLIWLSGFQCLFFDNFESVFFHPKKLVLIRWTIHENSELVIRETIWWAGHFSKTFCPKIIFIHFLVPLYFIF